MLLCGLFLSEDMQHLPIAVIIKACQLSFRFRNRCPSSWIVYTSDSDFSPFSLMPVTKLQVLARAPQHDRWTWAHRLTEVWVSSEKSWDGPSRVIAKRGSRSRKNLEKGGVSKMGLGVPPTKNYTSYVKRLVTSLPETVPFHWLPVSCSEGGEKEAISSRWQPSLAVKACCSWFISLRDRW